MLGNVLGERFMMITFGESHGKCIGVIVDGCPAGLPLQESDIQSKLDLRRPGQSIVTTQRREEDKVEILSGVFNGYTTGAPICMLIWNKDVDSKPYDMIKSKPRPGHADYPAYVKYKGFNDYRGGGRFSGRLTAAFVMAGALAEKLLRYTLGIEIFAYTKEIGGISMNKDALDHLDEIKMNRYSNEVRCPDSSTAMLMRDAIIKARQEGDSLGGIVECIAINLPIGLGEPIFGALESDISRALFAIPAVKGVEFGSGFRAARLKGSEHNDPYAIKDGKVVTLTNNAGGILGGLSNGMPLLLRVAFKPASSIAKTQRTVDIESMSDSEIVVPGRHDPCVVPRAVPVVEAMVAVVLADHAIRAGIIPPILGDAYEHR